MNKFTIVIILFLFAFEGFGQKLHVNANIGYGTYFLKDLKDFQAEMISSTTVDDKSVENFPNNIYYSFTTNYAFNKKHSLGLGLKYYTTGARNHVADYSGEYTFDMIANAYTLFVNYKVRIISTNNFNTYFQFKTGALFSRLDINEQLDIYSGNSNTTEEIYKGNSIVLEPGIYLFYPIYKTISLNLSVGFERGLNRRLLNKDDYDEEYITFIDDISANWTGLRTSIGISFSFGKK